MRPSGGGMKAAVAESRNAVGDGCKMLVNEVTKITKTSLAFMLLGPTGATSSRCYFAPSRGSLSPSH